MSAIPLPTGMDLPEPVSGRLVAGTPAWEVQLRSSSLRSEFCSLSAAAFVPTSWYTRK
jgi:hypothetical protein